MLTPAKPWAFTSMTKAEAKGEALREERRRKLVLNISKGLPKGAEGKGENSG